MRSFLHRNLIRLGCFCLLLGQVVVAQAADVSATWNGTTGDWSDSTKWDSALFPNNGNGGFTYDAVINSGTVTLDQDIEIEGLTFGSGTINGAFDLLLNAASTWTGGTMAGTGTITIASGATLAVTNNRGLSRNLINNGTTTLTAPGLNNTWTFTNATFQNNGSFTANTTFAPVWNGSGTSAFNNAGTFTKTGGDALSANLLFHNTGTVDVQGGQLQLRGGGSHTGTFSGVTGATLSFSGTHDFAATSDISGGMDVQFYLGTMTVNSSVSTTGQLIGHANVTFDGPVTAGTLSITQGTSTFNNTLNAPGGMISGGGFSGAADWDVTDVLHVANGWFDGTGTTTITDDATLNISRGFASDRGMALWRTVINYGSTIWTGGYFDLHGTTFQNNGTFIANVTNSPSIFPNSRGRTGGATNVSVFNNAGAFVKQGTNTASFGPDAGASYLFHNTGTVDVQGGQLQLRGGGSHTGTFSGVTGATLSFSGTHDFAATSDISGGMDVQFYLGTMTVNSSVSTTGQLIGHANVTFDGPVTAGTLSITQGTSTFNNTLNAPGGTISGGTLAGTGTVTLTGSFSWTSGTMAGTGATILHNGTISGTNAKTLNDRTLRSAGNIDWSQGNITTSGTRGLIHVPDGKTFTISGTGNRTLNANVQVDAGGTILHTSTGTTTHTAGSFVNNGLVKATAGVLQLNGDVSGTGTFYYEGSGEIYFPNGPGPNFSGGLSLDKGTLRLGVYSLTNGTIEGSGTVQSPALTNASIVSPGLESQNAIGAITIEGTYIQSSAGRLNIDLEGVNAGEFDTIAVTGSATLGGKLVIDATNLAPVPVGTLFPIMTAASMSGSFESIESIGDNNIYFAIRQVSTGAGSEGGSGQNDGVTTYAERLDRGDMNGDGIMDQADYDLFVFGLMNNSISKFSAKCNCDISSQQGGDFNGNGRLDFDDIPGFQNQLAGMGMSDFGLQMAFDNYISNVPEPTAGALVVVCGLFVSLTNLRRRGHKPMAA